ncbi:MAG: M20 family metallopeptidase [Actinobacteria bacterium]|nr:MAG: M20 family metallopeptidase [Actinomycetota bacterium]
MDVLAIRDLAAAHHEGYVASLRAMVDIDSGTFNRAGVNRIADLCEARFREHGWDVERIGDVAATGPELGDTVVGTIRGAGGARVLMIGHMDTVFDDA